MQKSRYKPLEHSRAPFFEKLKSAHADLIVFSKDRPLQLYAFLESTKKYISYLGSCTVIYHTAHNEYEKAYQEVKNQFPDIQFVRQSQTNPRDDFKALTIQALEQSLSDYILFAVDDIIIKDTIECNKAIKSLEETHAYAFYLRLGKNTHYCYSCNFEQGIPALLDLGSKVHAWQFLGAQGDWAYPHNVDMTLYRKKDILPILAQLTFYAPNSCEGAFATVQQRKKLGLCYTLSKIVNIPANIVQHEYNNRHMTQYSPEYLLHIFNQGLKIDIQPFYQIANNAAHTPFSFTFIKR